jgi:hypothetical protein
MKWYAMGQHTTYPGDRQAFFLGFWGEIRLKSALRPTGQEQRLHLYKLPHGGGASEGL